MSSSDERAKSHRAQTHRTRCLCTTRSFPRKSKAPTRHISSPTLLQFSKCKERRSRHRVKTATFVALCPPSSPPRLRVLVQPQRILTALRLSPPLPEYEQSCSHGELQDSVPNTHAHQQEKVALAFVCAVLGPRNSRRINYGKPQLSKYLVDFQVKVRVPSAWWARGRSCTLCFVLVSHTKPGLGSSTFRVLEALRFVLDVRAPFLTPVCSTLTATIAPSRWELVGSPLSIPRIL